MSTDIWRRDEWLGFAPRFCHIAPIMRDLRWLPIRVRINFKVFLLTFKALHGLAPQYLWSLISLKTSCYNLRGSNTLLLAMLSVKSKATLGDRAFAVAAPSLWNSIPSELRSNTCVTSLKLILWPTFLVLHMLNRDVISILSAFSLFTYNIL